jgi:hypothetical protein
MAETVGFLIISGLEATGIVGAGAAAAATTTTLFAGLTVAGAVGTAAIVGVSLAVSFTAQPKVPAAGDGSQPLRQSIPPRPFGYGRTRLAGAYVLFEVDDAQNSWDVLALHDGKISGVVHVYLNDDIVQLDGSGFVMGILNGASDDRYAIQDYPVDPEVRIKYNLGLPTETAFADVIAALPTLWTSDHRGDGVASLYLTCGDETVENLPKFYPRGLPKPSVVADLAPIWDPRDGAQSREDPDTWEVSSNPVLQLLDYLTHAERGPALDYDTYIAPAIDDWMAEADICDEAIDKVDGSTEPRYRSDGWAYLSTDPAEVIAAIVSTFDGWLAEAGDGTLRLFAGKYRAPEVTFTDDHILGFEIHLGVADEAIVNEVQFSYTAAQANWRDAPGVSMRDDASIAETGLVRSEMLQLPWVQSHSQGRRLAKRRLARHQATARGQLVTSLYGLKALGQRWVAVRSSRIADLANAVIEITKVNIDLASATLTFEWTLINPNEIDAWDADTEEGTPPAYFPVPVDVTASDAGVGNQINVEFDTIDPAQPWLYYVVDRRLGSSGPWTRQVFHAGTSLSDIGGGRVRLQTAAVGAGTYSVRVAATGRQVIPDGSTVLDPDLVWSPDVDGTSVVIS